MVCTCLSAADIVVPVVIFVFVSTFSAHFLARAVEKWLVAKREESLRPENDSEAEAEAEEDSSSDEEELPDGIMKMGGKEPPSEINEAEAAQYNQAQAVHLEQVQGLTSMLNAFAHMLAVQKQ